MTHAINRRISAAALAPWIVLSMSGFGKREPRGYGGVEQRRAERRPVQWNAWIVFDDRSAQQCLIRDVSDQGARLEVASILGIPDRFILRAGSGQLSALVVWRGIRQVGVKFSRE